MKAPLLRFLTLTLAKTDLRSGSAKMLKSLSPPQGGRYSCTDVSASFNRRRLATRLMPTYLPPCGGESDFSVLASRRAAPLNELSARNRREGHLAISESVST